MDRREMILTSLVSSGTVTLGTRRKGEAKSDVDDLKEMVDVMSSDGNYNYDPYMHGMANGAIFALSVLTGDEPKYLEAPKDGWLAEKAYEPAETVGT
tara:strand:- start:340 stop:630 length:291 start_codon:yes stop_codon:yes gene_type:complete